MSARVLLAHYPRTHVATYLSQHLAAGINYGCTMSLKQRSRQQRVGLILSGGGARGFAHIGVLRALEQANVRVDVIAGTSMGAILGAFYANGYDAAAITNIVKSISWRNIIDFSLQSGVLKGEKLHTLLETHLPTRFSALVKPLAVATTDIETGEEVFITDGDLITALRASSCFPGAFEPVKFQGRLLADGGIVNNLPVNAVSFLNASFTIASNTTPPRHMVFPDDSDDHWWERMMATVKLERRNPVAQMMIRSTDIMQSILTDIHYSMHPADVLVRHLMPGMNLESFRHVEDIIDLGEQKAFQTFVAVGLLEPPALPARADALTANASPDAVSNQLAEGSQHEPKDNANNKDADEDAPTRISLSKGS